MTSLNIFAFVIFAFVTFMNYIDAYLQISKSQWKDIRFIMNNPSVDTFAKNSLTNSIHECYRKKIKLNVRRFMKDHPTLCKKIEAKDLMVYADKGFIHSVAVEPLLEIDFDEYLKKNIYLFLYDGIDAHKNIKKIFKNQKI